MTSKDIGFGAVQFQDERRSNWIRRADDIAGVERLEAFFDGRGYEMHRHDTYAIGLTLKGVQSFHYRGSLRGNHPGGTIVLHPDELHDGQAGSEGGFLYRIVYVEPAAIQAVLGGRPLPFVAGGLSKDRRLFQATSRILGRIDEPMGRFEYDDAVYELAQALNGAAAASPPTFVPPRPCDPSCPLFRPKSVSRFWKTSQGAIDGACHAIFAPCSEQARTAIS